MTQTLHAVEAGSPEHDPDMVARRPSSVAVPARTDHVPTFANANHLAGHTAGDAALGKKPLLGLLVLSHGAAEAMEQIEAYYAHILHGRTPRPERVRALKERYLAIGGSSPLNHLTRMQAQQMAEHFGTMGITIRPYVGFQHTPPFIHDAVERMAADGVREAVVIVMTPYYSPLGVGHYLAEVKRALAPCDAPPDLHIIQRWDNEPEFLDLLERRVHDALRQTRATGPGPCHVVFTAHSLPLLRSNRDDPYAEDFGAVARAVADRVGVSRWSICYQSASDTGQPWLGPDILEELDRVSTTDARQVVVCPTSFGADNLEVLYDIGIEARRRAGELGLLFVQAAPFNDDPAFTGFLARMIARRIPLQAVATASSIPPVYPTAGTVVANQGSGT
jgi:protoporphyrin/coproporphyrin ferrochelatase